MLAIINSPVTMSEYFRSLAHTHEKDVNRKFSSALCQLTGTQYVYLVSSGTAAFYIILEALKRKSKRKEVVLPAYTAGSLVVAVRKAGLIPVLCDISPDDFNLNLDALQNAVSRDTLAVVCAHMFGIGIKNIDRIREKVASDIFVIEDCAQAMGSKVKEKHLGSFSDVSFWSFNRGKNVPAYGGGCFATHDLSLVGLLDEAYRRLVKEPAPILAFKIPFMFLLFSLAVRPYCYAMVYPFIASFRDTSPPADVAVEKNTLFQASIGSLILNKLEELSSKRRLNGMFLINELMKSDEIIVPKLSIDSKPAFNRLPVLIKNAAKKNKVKAALMKSGIEASEMYQKPLHWMFDLGYTRVDFPNANFVAEHLLTLPVHPAVSRRDLCKMAEVLRKI
jgi:perosamine synthetase